MTAAKTTKRQQQQDTALANIRGIAALHKESVLGMRVATYANSETPSRVTWELCQRLTRIADITATSYYQYCAAYREAYNVDVRDSMNRTFHPSPEEIRVACYAVGIIREDAI